MNNFQIYFEIGFRHIANWGALDHILFIAALVLRYQFADWKKLLVLVTAFTIGHTITLALAVFNLVNFSSAWIEFLIPLTIAITAISNLFVKKYNFKQRFPAIYFFALFFGLVHGLGFSNNLKMIIGNGTGVFIKLLAANIGIEVAQLMFVLFALIIAAICLSILKFNRREYILFISGGIFGIALYIALLRYLFN
jgi:hypothetical protein